MVSYRMVLGLKGEKTVCVKRRLASFNMDSRLCIIKDLREFLGPVVNDKERCDSVTNDTGSLSTITDTPSNLKPNSKRSQIPN